MYLAESPEVAKEYSKLNPAGGQIPSALRFVNGKEVHPGTGAYKAASLLDSMSVAQAKKTVNGWLQGARPEEQAYFKEVADTLGGITSKAAVKQKAPGGLIYKVDLPDEHIAKMLDWDKPLSQQHPDVQKALNGIETNFPEIPDFNLRKWMDADPLASTWHNVLQRDLGADPAMITGTLKDRGIPGIRYLDGGSRGAGQGSSNFVVFPGNEDILKIMERNGQGLLGN